MGRWKPGHPIAGRYTIESHLASGGMAEVYLARALFAGGVKRRVAIKRIHPHLASEQEFVEMFLDEARVASQLSHPGLVPVLDVVEGEGELLLVLEHVQGQDVSDLLRAVRDKGLAFPIPMALRITREVAATLAYVHSARDLSGSELQIVHRDVSPSNIFVGSDGGVRLLDFGVAKAASRATRTATRVFKGKFAYMAPEQARGEAVDARTDLYALGLTLFEMLTGTRAIEAPTDFALLEKARNPNHVHPKLLRPDLDDSVNALTARLVEPDPAKRFQNAAQVVEACAQSAEEAGTASPRDLVEFIGRVMDSPTDVGTDSTFERALRALARQGSRMGRSGLRHTARQGESEPGEDPIHTSTDLRIPVPHTWMTRSLLALGAAALVGLGFGWQLLQREPVVARAATAAPIPDTQPAETGFLRVTTDPPGAKLWVDDRSWGEPTPTVIPVQPGTTHELRCERQGYLAESGSWAVPPGEIVRIRWALRPTPGSLDIRTEPDGAHVWIDGELRGTTPLSLEDLPRRRLGVRLVLGDHADQSHTVELTEDPHVVLSTTMAPLPQRGVLDVSTEPWARVHVDGKLVAESTPLLGLRLQAGPHVVRLSNPGMGLSAVRRIRIQAGQRKRLIVRLTQPR